MTVFLPSLPAGTSRPPAGRRASPRATAPARAHAIAPAAGPGIPLTVTASCEAGCGWVETGSHVDWARLATATERHVRETGHAAVCEAHPAGRRRAG